MNSSKNLILALLILFTYCQPHPKKETKTESPQVTAARLAELDLQFEKEKIYLLSVLYSIPHDTVYQILIEYSANDLAKIIEGHIDSTPNSFKEYDEMITGLSRKYKQPKSRIASVIFSFKYEMVSKDEILEEYESARDIGGAEYFDH